MKPQHIAFLLLTCVCAAFPLAAQDDGFAGQSFGFGFEGEEGAGNLSGGALAVSVGGEVSASIVGYVDDFADGADKAQLGDLFSGKLNFTAESSRASGVIKLNLQPVPPESPVSPVAIDEAYVRAYFGSLDIEGGLRKLTWGKADSFGPLDVINPLDNTDMTDMSDLMNLKIARPLIHASFRIGSFSKLEGVFVPAFEPIRLASEGRWRPAQMAQLDQLEAAGVPVNRPDTATLTTIEYAQAGARFTTTVGPADIGVQYYYGRLTKPAVSMTFAPSLPPTPTGVTFAYNPYHQIGADWAQVLFGLNVRAELAANITGDVDGDDGTVYNPHLAWSFGFDRDLLWGINLNIQANETVTLLHNKIGDNPLGIDIEADTDPTATQIIAALTKTFFRDELEARVAVIWEPEAGDFLLTPSLVWTKDAVSIELSGGIFGGDKEGQFGQYRDNSFVKAALTYTF
ncbi:MAG: hypothetical protein LBK61_07910 [Spirochaetaceae bacterium]|jgi:hypothetical protein|nr:hypothetical protein [Spirochaetaceae bacterium]